MKRPVALVGWNRVHWLEIVSMLVLFIAICNEDGGGHIS